MSINFAQALSSRSTFGLKRTRRPSGSRKSRPENRRFRSEIRAIAVSQLVTLGELTEDFFYELSPTVGRVHPHGAAEARMVGWTVE